MKDLVNIRIHSIFQKRNDFSVNYRDSQYLELYAPLFSFEKNEIEEKIKDFNEKNKKTIKVLNDLDDETAFVKINTIAGKSFLPHSVIIDRNGVHISTLVTEYAKSLQEVPFKTAFPVFFPEIIMESKKIMEEFSKGNDDDLGKIIFHDNDLFFSLLFVSFSPVLSSRQKPTSVVNILVSMPTEKYLVEAFGKEKGDKNYLKNCLKGILSLKRGFDIESYLIERKDSQVVNIFNKTIEKAFKEQIKPSNMHPLKITMLTAYMLSIYFLRGNVSIEKEKMFLKKAYPSLGNIPYKMLFLDEKLKNLVLEDPNECL